MVAATPTRREFAAMASFTFSLQQSVPVGYHDGFSAVAVKDFPCSSIR